MYLIVGQFLYIILMKCPVQRGVLITTSEDHTEVFVGSRRTWLSELFRRGSNPAVTFPMAAVGNHSNGAICLTTCQKENNNLVIYLLTCAYTKMHFS